MEDDNQYNGQNQQYSDYSEDQYGQYQADETETDALQDGDKSQNQMDSSKGKSEDDRKLFIGGVSWETRTNDLKDYFSRYGEVVDVNIKIDPNTGNCRGFAFVTFASQESVDAVIKDGTHTVKGKQIDPKKAKSKPGAKKIFVGGLDPNMPASDIKAYFKKFGKVETVELPVDKVKNQRRQFAFVTFETEEAVNEVIKQPKQMIGSKECDIKKATPKPDYRTMRGGFMGGWGSLRSGANGERGRGRGDYMAEGWESPGYGGYSQGYGSYNQGYGSYDYGGYSGDYGGGYSGYDYSRWGPYGQSYGQQDSVYGKTRGAVRGRTTTSYHPYR
ncbi:heterogeneous nuclear ribonucleoprotein A/B-like isoform X2 [Tachypleus tridentatus]|uniref:heterogeneous nuclear ribonucleoprotein A/B-like isoform X2 n=1 Tax=Tachypleus tridentatus TaxID=6853 RepID=UPI003FD42B72